MKLSGTVAAHTAFEAAARRYDTPYRERLPNGVLIPQGRKIIREADVPAVSFEGFAIVWLKNVEKT